MSRKEYDKAAEKLIQSLIDNKRLIESGWETLRSIYCPISAPPEQISDMRISFFHGASFLFESIMRMLEPEKEPTAKDEERMTAIQIELEKFEKDFRAKMRRRCNS